VNDTTRELGGAVGIALMGSVANTAYRSSVDLDGLQISAGSRAVAEESIGAAHGLAQGLPGGEALAAQAASAFTDAFAMTSVVSVGIALAAAGAVLAFSRRRRTEPALDDDELQRAIDEYGLEPVRVPVEARE
jgi:DHA2 family multidrug resistance protein-like MFS transporter